MNLYQGTNEIPAGMDDCALQCQLTVNFWPMTVKDTLRTRLQTVKTAQIVKQARQSCKDLDRDRALEHHGRVALCKNIFDVLSRNALATDIAGELYCSCSTADKQAWSPLQHTPGSCWQADVTSPVGTTSLATRCWQAGVIS